MTIKISKAYVIILELSIIILLYGVIMWILIPVALSSSPIPLLLLFGSAVVYYFIISPFFVHRDSLRSRGLGERKNFFIRLDNFNEAWHLLFFPFILISVVIIFASWQKDTIFFSEPDWHRLFFRFIIYLFSAFFQDIFFFSLLFIRIKKLIIIKEDIYKQIMVTLLFAIIFSIFHMPNIPIMILTFIFAFWLGFIFYKVPNLYVTVIIHAFLGTLLHFVYGLHMKVGIFYGFEGNIIRSFILK